MFVNTDVVTHPGRSRTSSEKHDASYIAPGHLAVSREPMTFVAVLGSCVAVCLWDAKSGIGGLNHFLLPEWFGGAQSPKFGDVANTTLIHQMAREGASLEGLTARVFGGACVIEELRASHHELGRKNVEAAQTFLARHRIRVVQEDVGGGRGRRVTFRTGDGHVTVRHL